LQDGLGCCAVTWAAHVDCRDALAVCLHAGAYWGTLDVYGQTPLHAAVAGGAVRCAHSANEKGREWTGWTHTGRWKRPCLQTAHMTI
jgi:hypothetical protein